MNKLLIPLYPNEIFIISVRKDNIVNKKIDDTVLFEKDLKMNPVTNGTITRNADKYEMKMIKTAAILRKKDGITVLFFINNIYSTLSPPPPPQIGGHRTPLSTIIPFSRSVPSSAAPINTTVGSLLSLIAK